MLNQSSLAHGPAYKPLCAWWTYDAPSLRVPDVANRYVSIWSTGSSGPSVLLVHGRGSDHREWEPVLPMLGKEFIVSALDVSLEDSTSTAGAASIRVAAEAVGADVIVAQGDSAEAVLLGAPTGTEVLLWEPTGDVSDNRSGRANVVIADQKASPVLHSTDARPRLLANKSSAMIAEMLRRQAGTDTPVRPDEGDKDDDAP